MHCYTALLTGNYSTFPKKYKKIGVFYAFFYYIPYNTIIFQCVMQAILHDIFALIACIDALSRVESVLRDDGA